MEPTAELSRTDSKVKDALIYALDQHEGQTRKYPKLGQNEEYVNHPIRVARQLMNWGLDWKNALAVALLHDVLEDTSASIPDLYSLFGPMITVNVIQVTEISAGALNHTMTREERKDLYRSQICLANHTVHVVKMADVFDNLSDFELMVQDDHDFAELYLEEKNELLQDMYPYLKESYIPAFKEVDNLIEGCYQHL